MQKYAFISICILSFVIPWQDMLTIGGIGTISKVVGMNAFFASILYLLNKREITKPHPLHILVLLFFIWGILTFLWSKDISLSSVRLWTNIQMLIMIFLLFEFSQTEKRWKYLFQSYVLGAYVSAISTIINFLTNYQDLSYVRYTATGYNAGALGTILALGIPIAWFLSLDLQNKLMVVINRLYVIIAFITIPLTGTRTAFFASIVALIYILWSSRSLSILGKIMLFILCCTTVSVMLNFIPESLWERIGNTSDQISSGDLTGRVYIWKGALTLISEHPFFGIGVGAFQSAISQLIGENLVAHNSFLSILTELGLLGFTIFIALLLGLILKLISYKSNSHKIFLLTLFLMWLIGANFGSDEYTKTTWFLFSLIISLKDYKNSYDFSYKKSVLELKNGGLK